MKSTRTITIITFLLILLCFSFNSALAAGNGNISLKPKASELTREEWLDMKFKMYREDYYFVIEEALRDIVYNAEDLNMTICHGESQAYANYINRFANDIIDIEALMGRLGLYDDLNMWPIFNMVYKDPQCGVDHDLIAEVLGAEDRLHRQTEKLGLWVPSTGTSSYIDRSHCGQGEFTAPNGVCLNQYTNTETRYYHSNGYVMVCKWPGGCNEAKALQMDRCDWINCE